MALQRQPERLQVQILFCILNRAGVPYGVGQRLRQGQRLAEVESFFLSVLRALLVQRRISGIFIELLCGIILEWFRRRIRLASRVLVGGRLCGAVLL